MISSVTTEIVKRLALFLKTGMPDLQEVLELWPDPNYALKYPSMSVFTPGEPTHTPIPPYLISNAPSPDAAKLTYKYVVGMYEWKMQLDMWCSSKFQRHVLYDKFFQAFNGQFISGNTEVMGISLPLTDYHNTIARYDLISYNFDDSESSSQRKEWRAKFGIIAHCKAILDRDVYRIDETELLDDDIKENIVIPE